MTVDDAVGRHGWPLAPARTEVVDGAGLAGPVPPRVLVEVAEGDAVSAYRRLRRDAFVHEQALFPRHDLDEQDEDPRAVVLVARGAGHILGGVRLAPATDPDIGWWHGSRLVVAPGARSAAVGAALVRAACAHAEAAGALRFEAAVQHPAYFRRLGWYTVGQTDVAGRPHTHMRWPIGRVAALVDATKTPLGALLAGMAPGGAGWVGDDAAPVPGSDLLAACDAILPAMVERDPWWAGWCSVLVNINDLTAMGAAPVGLLDAVGARSAAAAAQVLAGFTAAARAWGVPVLGGHTTLGVPASMAVTALGRSRRPVPAGGGRPGHVLTVTADLTGNWRPGYTGRQWDSTSHRDGAALTAMTRTISDARPAAAKDVSMAGLVGTLGMLAEASGCAAVLDVGAVPRPPHATVGDWLTCFPGFAMVSADHRGRRASSPFTHSAPCGELVAGAGVSLRWPDGALTPAVSGPVTGMGVA